MISEIPKLMMIWDVENNKVPASSVSAASKNKVWWVCPKGHHYEREPFYERIRDGCPICKKEAVIRVADKPDLMERWAVPENSAEGLSPDKVTVSSPTKVWWRCEKEGHLYQRSPLKENKSIQGCPLCRKTVADDTELMKQWAAGKNEENGLFADKLGPRSGKNAWWICKEGHLYQRSINHMSRNGDCPICKSESQKYVSDYPDVLIDFAYDLNETPPNMITAGSDSKIVWRCHICNKIFTAQPYHRIKDHTGCPFCFKAKRKQPKESSLEQERVAREKKNLLRQESLIAKQQEKELLLQQKNEAREERKKSLEQRKLIATRQKEDALVAKKQAKIEAKLPDNLMKYWDATENERRNLSLEHLVIEHRLYSWTGECGHKWKSPVSSMKKNPTCPICAEKENSIASKFPQLITLYDTEKNGGHTPDCVEAKTSNYFWWKCKRGHSFIATLASVAAHKETGCMYCDKEKSYYSV